jgi:hypothetical protein
MSLFFLKKGILFKGFELVLRLPTIPHNPNLKPNNNVHSRKKEERTVSFSGLLVRGLSLRPNHYGGPAATLDLQRFIQKIINSFRTYVSKNTFRHFEIID